MLESFDLTVEEVRAQVARIVGQGDEVTTGQIPFTRNGKKMLELALREALSLGANHVGTEHLLLGLARLDEGVAATILLDFDLDGQKIRDEVVRMLSGPQRRRTEVPPSDPTTVWDAVAAEERRLVERQSYEAAASLREDRRRLYRLLQSPPEGRWEYDVKTLEGASDTWVAQLEEWRRDGWELISVVQEGGAVRAIVERRRRSHLD